MEGEPKQQTRFAVLLSTTRPPRWLADVLQKANESHLIELVAIIHNAPPERIPSHPLVDKYVRMDNRLFSRGKQPSDEVDMPEALSQIPHIQLTLMGETLSDVSKQTLRDLDIHIMLSPGTMMLTQELVKLTRDGLLFFDDYRYESSKIGPKSFWEIFHQHPVANISLYAQRPEDSCPRLIERGHTRRHPYSISQTHNRRLWIYKQLATKRLKMLHHFGAEETLQPVSEDEEAVNKPLQKPSPFHVIPVAFRALLKVGIIVLTKIRDKTNYKRARQWIPYYHFTPGSTEPSLDVHQFTKLDPGNERFWADPFVVRHNDEIYVFLEEFSYHLDRGHIVVAQVNEDGSLETPELIIKTDYHLAYPHVIKWNDTYYMMPDSDMRRIELHRCKSFPYEWTLDRVLMEGPIYADPTTIEIDGVWWLFVTQSEDYDHALEELHIYYADSPLGPFQPHPRNPVKIDVRYARPAGEFFWRDGKLFRPVQSSQVRYGDALHICEITKLTKEEFEEKVIDTLLPKWDLELEGTHTLNWREGITFIDGVRWIRPDYSPRTFQSQSFLHLAIIKGSLLCQSDFTWVEAL